MAIVPLAYASRKNSEQWETTFLDFPIASISRTFTLWWTNIAMENHPF